MSSTYFKTEGLIIKKTPFGEADFLVRMLTKDFGKMDALAKGARKPASKLNSHLDILNHVRIQFVKPARPAGGNGERMPTLTDAEVLSRFDGWFANADSISLAGRILQTIDLAVLPGSKDEGLFSMTVEFLSAQGLARASTSGGQPEESAIKFIREFFKHEGYGDSLPGSEAQLYYPALPDYCSEAILKLWPELK